MDLKNSKKISKTVLLGILIITINGFYNSAVVADSSNLKEDTPSAVAFLPEDEPVIGDPFLDSENPVSNESVIVTFPIEDPEGIRNATLYWQYHVNDTLYNSTMSETSTRVVNTIVWDRTGKVTDLGVETNDYTGWQFGEYIYESTTELISSIDTIIDISRVDNFLVYVLIEAKNSSTGLWETKDEVGSIGGDTVDLAMYSYTKDELVMGYRIYAITHFGDKANGNVGPPSLTRLYLDQVSYDAEIPAIDEPTFVSYYVTAFDMLNFSATSQTYELLMDWRPTITFNNLPVAITGGQDYLVNVTVSDLDGVSTIDSTDVNVYYKIEGEEIWSTSQLTHDLNINATHDYYTATISLGASLGIEENLLIIANVSDVIGGEIGLTGSTALEILILDGLAPRVTEISLDGSIQDTNITLSTAEVNITAVVEDPAGISSVRIFYGIDENYDVLSMINQTEIRFEETPSNFTVILPAANASGFVDYFFETTDFLGNAGNTSLNSYYSDGLSPDLDDFLIYPEVTSSLTNTSVLFNASDFSGLMQTLLWYSFDGGITWVNTLATAIDYSDEIDHEETFVAEELKDHPFLISDNDISYLPLEVERGGGVDRAILTIVFSHEQSTDLRIWLLLDDGQELLIFDRLSESDNVEINVDLMTFGLTQEDFDSANFTLKIQDYAELYSGSITKYEITLEHYEIPFGYQFKANIPKTGNDTDVMFYITLTDKLLNSANTTTFDYYSDGLAPEIELEDVSTLDLEKSHFVHISAEVTDLTGVYWVDLYYYFDNVTDWKVVSMIYDEVEDIFYYDAPILNTSGKIVYYVRAFDLAGHSSETEIQTIDFFNGKVDTGDSEDSGVSNALKIIGIIGLSVVILGGIGAAVYYYLKKKK